MLSLEENFTEIEETLHQAMTAYAHSNSNDNASQISEEDSWDS